MALIDVVKCEMNDDEFVYKFPSEDLRIGSQLVVYPAQTAFFVKGGQVCDEFHSGTYTLKDENIPILNKLINIPFGANSPFQAEVWFISQVAKLDIKWGTPQPIQLEDPKYNIIVPMRAYGQYGFRIAQPRIFLESLIGNMTSFTAEKIETYFKGKIVTQLSTLLASKITMEGVSVLDISVHLLEMSAFCQEYINTAFSKYGIELVDFNIMSINVPQDDVSIIKLKEAKDMAARLKVTGRDVYQMERSFDVLETAAGNTGTGGQWMTMGAGLGAGVGVGSAIGQMASQMINTNPTTPPIPTNYYIYLNGQQVANQTAQTIAALISQRQVDGNTLVWAAGMPNWSPISNVPELAALLCQQTPPPVPLQIQ